MDKFVEGDIVFHISQTGEISKTKLLVLHIKGTSDYDGNVKCSWMSRKGKYHEKTFYPRELEILTKA